MATTVDFIEFVCEQIRGFDGIRYKKMFGEYLVYINDKPILLVCDNTVFVKKLDCIAKQMQGAEVGFPYSSAKEHYILDIDNAELTEEVIKILEPVIDVPKPKKRRSNNKIG